MVPCIVIPTCCVSCKLHAHLCRPSIPETHKIYSCLYTAERPNWVRSPPQKDKIDQTLPYNPTQKLPTALAAALPKAATAYPENNHCLAAALVSLLLRCPALGWRRGARDRVGCKVKLQLLLFRQVVCLDAVSDGLKKDKEHSRVDAIAE